jgi:hypothetical protein
MTEIHTEVERECKGCQGYVTDRRQGKGIYLAKTSIKASLITSCYPCLLTLWELSGVPGACNERIGVTKMNIPREELKMCLSFLFQNGLPTPY